MTKQYTVAYMSFFDNDLRLAVVEATSELEAAKKFLYDITDDKYKQGELDEQASENYPKDMEALKEYHFNADAVINVIEIPTK
ncbi:hypothetical protein MA9V2_234 [Chryseobacterium phage MA9V-2]|nr:hypothetical protein MA9V2_234 [Chryseobacterium phage MA9V-2]